ncbi:MAG: helix-turn-helix domain-containing protein [Phycisphaerae bacterium]|nr:helix-turn-helix domain-containing protein [Phycisphaerae bacterium]
MVKKQADIEERLRQAIITSHMSRYRISKISGVSEIVLSRFVRRQRSLTLRTAAKLAAALDLDLRPKKKGR